MDGSYYRQSTLVDPSIHLIMDNDSGYVSNNLDQESNSYSALDNSDTCTVDILRSFLPKPVYLSEDALLECPYIDKNIEEKLTTEGHNDYIEDSPDLVIPSSLGSEKTYHSFNSSQTDSEISDSSMVIPIADPIYFDLNSKIHSSPPAESTKWDDRNFEILTDLQSSEKKFKLKDISVDVPKSNFARVCECSQEKPVKAFDLLKSTNEAKQSKGTLDQLTPEIVKDAFSVVDENDFSINKSIPTVTNDYPHIKQKESLNFGNTIAEAKESIEFVSSEGLRARVGTPRKRHMGINPENNILTNVTNLCSKTDKSSVTGENCNKIFVRKRTNSSKDKENISQSEIFKTPSKGVKRKLNESASPDLFSDDESSKPIPVPSPKIIEERFVHKLDQTLLKRVQKDLSGVPPPPDFTITKFTVNDILQKLKENENYFWTNEALSKSENEKCVLRTLDNSPGCSGSILIDGNFEEATNKEFPDILYSRHHGLHHNRNKLSEEIEYFCDKYSKRYIGAETQSTCCAVETKYMSPAKRKAMKQKWASKSPGRRLSHLARRRITFSSANLQAGSSSNAASRARQILIDYKKLELLNHKKSPRKSPRKTPRKSPNSSPSQGRTPSSSAKKKLRLRFRLLSGDFKESAPGPSSSIAGSKRALFQSPDNENKFKNILSNSSTSSCSSFNSDLNSRGTKRSLFPSPSKIGCRSSLFSSPKKKSPFKNMSFFEKKRKRDESDDGISRQSKFFRSQSTDVGSSKNNQTTYSSLPRTKSDSVLPSLQPLVDLSAAHKKKLQWAVYESLKLQNISTSHPQFKVYASVLARVTRRFILTSNVRLEGGTSEKMLRIARHHSFAVVKGKSVEEIMSDYNRNKAKSTKPQGYIAPEDYQKAQAKESSVGKESALKDRSNTGDSIRSSNSRPNIVKPESRIDRIRKVINFEDNR